MFTALLNLFTQSPAASSTAPVCATCGGPNIRTESNFNPIPVCVACFQKASASGPAWMVLAEQFPAECERFVALVKTRSAAMTLEEAKADTIEGAKAALYESYSIVTEAGQLIRQGDLAGAQELEAKAARLRELAKLLLTQEGVAQLRPSVTVDSRSPTGSDMPQVVGVDLGFKR